MGKKVDAMLKELGYVTETQVAKDKQNLILAVLRARFKKVSKQIETGIRNMSDPIALESLNVHAATCKSLEEFTEALR
jgi:hypothetical protein